MDRLTSFLSFGEDGITGEVTFLSFQRKKRHLKYSSILPFGEERGEACNRHFLNRFGNTAETIS